MSAFLPLVASPYIYGFTNGLHRPSLHFVCEINSFDYMNLPLLVLACSETYVKEIAMFVEPHCLLKLEYIL